jgi:hypothetical protein
MHDHGLKIGFRQRIREMQDKSFADCFTPDKFSIMRRTSKCRTSAHIMLAKTISAILKK